jgi:hypothetical protein
MFYQKFYSQCYQQLHIDKRNEHFSVFIILEISLGDYYSSLPVTVLICVYCLAITSSVPFHTQQHTRVHDRCYSKTIYQYSLQLLTSASFKYFFTWLLRHHTLVFVLELKNFLLIPLNPLTLNYSIKPWFCFYWIMIWFVYVKPLVISSRL